MATDSQPPFPPAETLGVEIPNQQLGSPNSDYFSPRSDDESTDLFDSPLSVEDLAEESRGFEAEDGDGVLNSSPRSSFSPDLKCDEVPVNPLESGSPYPLNYNDCSSIVPSGFLSMEQVHNFRPVIAGSGLGNLGNTCFLNSVLQCFMHTVPLVHGILSDKHSMHSLCTNGEFCVICSFRHMLQLSLLSSDKVVLPWDFFNHLSYFSSSFQKFQQEDAHEFLQCFLDRLESCDSKQKDSMPSPPDNIVKQVFGGRLVSKLKCCSCDHVSDTYEPLIDLSLEIEDADSLLTALHSFTKVEKLEDPETKFTCEQCKEQVSVEKQLSFDEAPLVAAFHLKRFKTDGYLVEKIDKHVSFPLDLDLLPFTDTGRHNKGELKYELYAVVVHIGLTATSGHYYCFIRLAPNVWCKFDDSKVFLVPEDYVLSQEAYILFYAKAGTPWFSYYFETRNMGLQLSRWTTSPKSVLDTAVVTSPNLQDKVTSNSNEADDDNAADYDFGKVEIQYRRPTCSNAEKIESKDNSASVMPTVHDSPDVPLPESPKKVSPLNPKQNAVVTSPNLQDKVTSNSNEADDDIAADYDFGKVEIQYRRPTCSNAESKDNSASVVPTVHDSPDVPQPESRKKVSPLNPKQNASASRISQEVTKEEPIRCPSREVTKEETMRCPSREVIKKEPVRCPSPEIYRDDPPDAGFSIPREHLKLSNRISCKRRLDKEMDDMQTKQACKLIKKTMCGARGQQFLSVLENSKNEALSSQKKGKKRSGMPDGNKQPVVAGSYR